MPGAVHERKVTPESGGADLGRKDDRDPIYGTLCAEFNETP
jgi:hypothetical protein